jgi:hypothetical protein
MAYEQRLGIPILHFLNGVEIYATFSARNSLQARTEPPSAGFFNHP